MQARIGPLGRRSWNHCSRGREGGTKREERGQRRNEESMRPPHSSKGRPRSTTSRNVQGGAPPVSCARNRNSRAIVRRVWQVRPTDRLSGASEGTDTIRRDQPPELTHRVLGPAWPRFALTPQGVRVLAAPRNSQQIDGGCRDPRVGVRQNLLRELESLARHDADGAGGSGPRPQWANRPSMPAGRQ